jgi:hypothetical protein
VRLTLFDEHGAVIQDRHSDLASDAGRLRRRLPADRRHGTDPALVAGAGPVEVGVLGPRLAAERGRGESRTELRTSATASARRCSPPPR